MYHTAPQAGLASLLASRGRNGDSVLVHMTPGEVKGLQALALAQGGSLTINPDTGLPEANILKKLLPTIAGGVLNAIFPGMGSLGTALAVAGVTGLAEGSISKGLKAGMGAYSGAAISEGLRAAAQANRAGMLAAAPKTATSEIGGMYDPEQGAEISGIAPPAPPPVPKPVTPMPAIGKGSYVSEGIKGLLGKDPSGRKAFMEAIGGPRAAGFVAAPIMQAFDEYEMERAERAQRRRQAPEYYYHPGKFDFQTGTFAPGAYYTQQGKPYTPPNPWGFADGGLAMIDPRSNPGGDPNIMVAAPGTIIPPSEAYSFTQDPAERRRIVDQYIADLNARLARGLPKYAPTPAPTSAYWGETTGGEDVDLGGTSVGPGSVTDAIGGVGGIGGTSDGPVFTQPGVDLQDQFPVTPRPPFFSGPTTVIPVPVEESEDSVSIEVADPELIGGDYTGLPISVVGSGAGAVVPIEPPPAEKEDSVSIEVADPELIGGDYTGLPISVGGGGGDFSQPPISAGTGTATIPLEDVFPELVVKPEDLETSVPVEVPSELDPLVQESLYDAEQEQNMEDVLNWLEQQGYGPDVLGAQDTTGTVTVQPALSDVLKVPEPAIQETTPVDVPEGLDPSVVAALEAAGDDPSLWDKVIQSAKNPESYSPLIGALFGPFAQMAYDAAVKKFAVKTETLTPEEAAAEETAAQESVPQEPVPQEPPPSGGVPMFESDFTAPIYRGVYDPFADPFSGLFGGGGGGRPAVQVIEMSPAEQKAEQDTADFLDWLQSEGYARGGSVRRYSAGGIGSLPQYRAGGKYLNGPGDGMSDDIKANIEGRQEARLADGEFVIPADVVSHLGNGSSNAGAKKLHQMMDRIRQARTGKKSQAPAVDADRYLPV